MQAAPTAGTGTACRTTAVISLRIGASLRRMPTWLVPFLPLLGALVGAAAQHFLSRTQDAERQHLALRTSAYVDYLRGVSASARARQDGSEVDQAKAIALVADAKARMAVYGGAATLHALAELGRRGDSLATEEGRSAFVTLSETMRAESGREVVERDDLARVLFVGGVASSERLGSARSLT